MSTSSPLAVESPRRARAALVAILALGFALRAFGLGYGLPNREHAQTYDPDEWTPMIALRAMHPGQLEFNPHYFDNPTLVYYLYGAGIAAGAATGWIRIEHSERFYYEHPEQVARMVLVGRLLSLVAGALTPWLAYLLARRWRVTRGWALFAALATALHGSLVLHSHFMTVNAVSAATTLAALLALERWHRRGTLAAAAWAGVGVGLALASKYTGALLAVAVLVTGWARLGATSPRRAAAEVGVVLAVALALLFATSPYLLLAFSEARGRLTVFSRALHPLQGRSWIDGLRHALFVYVRTLTWASTPVLAFATGIGVVAALRRDRTAPPAAAAAWWIAFSLVALQSGHLLTDSRLMPLYSAGSVLAAFGLCALARVRRFAAHALAGLSIALALPWAVIVAARFTDPAPQAEASRWLTEHTRGDESMWVAGTGAYFSPDLVMREFFQEGNAGEYERRTHWRFFPQNRSPQTTIEEARGLRPELVVLTIWRPLDHAGEDWLGAPEYRIAAHFSGRMRVGATRILAPLDCYDVDAWILRRVEPSERP